MIDTLLLIARIFMVMSAVLGLGSMIVESKRLQSILAIIQWAFITVWAVLLIVIKNLGGL